MLIYLKFKTTNHKLDITEQKNFNKPHTSLELSKETQENVGNIHI